MFDVCSASLYSSRKHVRVMYTPLNPTFVQQKWGTQWYTYFFLFLLQNIDCGYSLEPPQQAVLTSTHNLCFGAKIRKNIKLFLQKIFNFYNYRKNYNLHGRVFVMQTICFIIMMKYRLLLWASLRKHAHAIYRDF